MKQVKLSEREIKDAAGCAGTVAGVVIGAGVFTLAELMNAALEIGGYGWFYATLFGGVIVLLGFASPLLNKLYQALYKSGREGAEYKHLKRGK